ncbi:flagellar hook-associated protein 3 [Pseudomonas sp. LTJR-52]|uniref:flagellar hook-associated protein 3 n=1 Tax=Pseudomonas sp. LTJR-52 TaxID=2479392 RepID=UPI000EFCFFA6|nr:flagellar hook-associated protein 3 [Pseudomonas sp. LTJR-52]AYN94981.1 flagellar hook-associated protein 3 [Pseudomonas sp. LTJR-52]
MRISTSQYYSSSISGYNKGYADITKTQQQISSGSRIQTPADDPVGSAQLLQLKQQEALLGQYSANMTTAANSLNQEESVLSSMGNVLQRARELTLQAGDGSLTDDDRKAVSDELGQIQEQLLTLMNSKDASGNYIFAGSKTGTVPFVKNSDGTYSYQGDQNTLSLQVSDSSTLPTNDNGWSIFEASTNASRTTASVTANPATDGTQRVFVSQGTVSNDTSYNKAYRDDTPYTLEVVNDKQYKLYDKDGNDITSEAGTNGVYDANSSTSNSVTFRGATFQLDVSLAKGDDGGDISSLTAGYKFSLGSANTSFSTVRSATNTSSAQISSVSLTDQSAYSTTFPAGGVTLKFTSNTDYAVYSLPTSSTATPIGNGSLGGSTYPQTISVKGVDMSISAAPASGDQFSITAKSSEKQNILDTIGQLRSALEASSSEDPQSQLTLRNSVASAISNLDNGMTQIQKTQSSVGARLNTIDTLKEENQSLMLVNKSTQSTINDTDMAAAVSQLTLQKTKLEAAQQAFVAVAQLSLFNKL